MKNKNLENKHFRGFFKARTGFEPVMTVLQTGALPLGYRAIFICLSQKFCKDFNKTAPLRQDRFSIFLLKTYVFLQTIFLCSVIRCDCFRTYNIKHISYIDSPVRRSVCAYGCILFSCLIGQIL